MKQYDIRGNPNNMNTLLLLSIALICVTQNLVAQNEISIGSTHQLYSNSLNDTIGLQVYLPEDYDNSDDDYPILYVLDGHWFFSNGVAIQKSIRGNRIMPKMIVVGIDMVDRPYRSKLFDQWDAFITFLETELVSYVNQSFRTKDEHIIFGWESCGYLASDLILRKNSPFVCSIVASGAYINEDVVESLNLNDERYFFLAGSKKDIYSIDDTDQVAHDLEAADIKNLKWNYQLFNEEEHETLAYAIMYHGLKFFYHNYGSLVFGSIEEFYEKGGLPYLTEYFDQRGKRFSISTEIDASTKNSLIWLAWKRDNFEAFDLFMTEFSDVLSTKRYANAYWQNRLGQYYLRYKSYDKAISFFDQGINAYPDEKYDAEMHAGIGMAYHGNARRKLAKKHLQKSIAIARTQGDSKLKEYQKLLSQILD